jgi:hypothetical protein
LKNEKVEQQQQSIDGFEKINNFNESKESNDESFITKNEISNINKDNNNNNNNEDKIVNEEDEDEWNESSYVVNNNNNNNENLIGNKIKPKTSIHNTNLNPQTTEMVKELNQHEVVLDKINLKTMKSIQNYLSILFDSSIDAFSNYSEAATSKDKKTILKFPLNQLTWQELARMSMLTFILTEMGVSREETQYAVRGSKQPNYRTSKNIVRNIRYRLLTRKNVKLSLTALKNKEDSKLNFFYMNYLNESRIQYDHNRLHFLNDKIDGEDHLAVFPFLLKNTIENIVDNTNLAVAEPKVTVQKEQQRIVFPLVKTNFELRESRPFFNDFSLLKHI